MNEAECCRVLGLTAGEWTSEGLRKAFKAKARKWHPDKNLSRVELAERKMQQINAAYSALKDYTRRTPVHTPAPAPTPAPTPAPAPTPIYLTEQEERQLLIRLNMERGRVINAKFRSVFDVEFLLTLWVVSSIPWIRLNELDVTSYWWQTVAEIWFGYRDQIDMSRNRHIKALMTREFFTELIGARATSMPWLSIAEARHCLMLRRQNIKELGAVRAKDWDALRKESVIITTALNAIP